jgi:hypothetical protein
MGDEAAGGARRVSRAEFEPVRLRSGCGAQAKTGKGGGENGEKKSRPA